MGKRQPKIDDILIYTGNSCQYAEKGCIWQPSEVCSYIDGVYFKDQNANTDRYRFATDSEIKWFELGITNINNIPKIGMTYYYPNLSKAIRTIKGFKYRRGIIITSSSDLAFNEYVEMIEKGNIKIINNKSNINKNESSETIKLQGEIAEESSKTIRGRSTVLGRQKQASNGSRPVGNKVTTKVKRASVGSRVIQGRIINP